MLLLEHNKNECRVGLWEKQWQKACRNHGGFSSRRAGCAEVYPGPAALLACFKKIAAGVIVGCHSADPAVPVATWRVTVDRMPVQSGKSMLSAGILAYRKAARGLEVLLVHPGGPFWRNKDEGAWSIPKGEIDGAEDPERSARREFAEELGPGAFIGSLQPIGEVRQRAGKRVVAFAGEGRFDPMTLASNMFEVEWPPRSGRRQAFPEVDRAEWFPIELARTKMLPAQAELLDRLLSIATLGGEPG